MAHNWQTVQLGYISQMKYGKIPQKSDLPDNGYPVFSGYRIVGFHKEYLYEEPQIVVVARGVGRTGDVRMSPPRSFITNLSIIVQLNEKVADKDFFYYYLQAQNLKNLDSGSAQSQITINDLKKLQVYLPPLQEQQKIAAILSALDDKIELNHKINSTLDDIVKLLFRKWFVDYEFPDANGQPYKSNGGKLINSELGPIPEGWEAKSIGELLDFSLGGDWGKDNPAGDAWIKCSCIRGADFPPLLKGDISKIPVRYIKKNSRKKRELAPGDILIEISGGTQARSTGRTVFIHRDLIKTNQTPLAFSNFCRLMRGNSRLDSYILFLYLQYIYDLGKMAEYEWQSTGISNFQFKYFCEKQSMAVAPFRIQEEFLRIVRPIRDKRYIFENHYLTRTLNFLLPKLVMGEITTSRKNP